MLCNTRETLGMPEQWQQCKVFSIYTITAFMAFTKGTFLMQDQMFLKTNVNQQRDRYMSQPDKPVAQMLRVKTHPVLPKPLARILICQKKDIHFICSQTWNWNSMETTEVILIIIQKKQAWCYFCLIRNEIYFMDLLNVLENPFSNANSKHQFKTLDHFIKINI